MVELLDITSAPKRFFNILPADWRIEIEPYWLEYSGDCRIYGLNENESIIGGGIVFSTVSPDTRGYRDIAQRWLDRGYLYLGFIYVIEHRRGEGLGTLWIKEVKALNDEQRFWLSIDDKGLSSFYQRLGFKIVQEVQNAGEPEWILVES
jgi:GNAT superfamily N-acetyltransferase